MASTAANCRPSSSTRVIARGRTSWFTILTWRSALSPANTLTKTAGLEEPAARYLGMVEASAMQLGELLDELGLAARIEGGRYEAVRNEADTAELARAAAERLDQLVVDLLLGAR